MIARLLTVTTLACASAIGCSAESVEQEPEAEQSQDALSTRFADPFDRSACVGPQMTLEDAKARMRQRDHVSLAKMYGASRRRYCTDAAGCGPWEIRSPSSHNGAVILRTGGSGLGDVRVSYTQRGGVNYNRITDSLSTGTLLERSTGFQVLTNQCYQYVSDPNRQNHWPSRTNYYEIQSVLFSEFAP